MCPLLRQFQMPACVFSTCAAAQGYFVAGKPKVLGVKVDGRKEVNIRGFGHYPLDCASKLRRFSLWGGGEFDFNLSVRIRVHNPCLPVLLQAGAVLWLSQYSLNVGGLPGVLGGVINDADHPHTTGDVWGPVRINDIVEHIGGEAANVGDGRLGGLVQVSE